MFDGVGWPCELRSISRTGTWSLSFLMNSSSQPGAARPGRRARPRLKSFGLRLEVSRDYPPLRQSVVPGDRVTVAIDPEIPDVGIVFAAIAETLREAGVEGENLTVLLPSPNAFRARRIAARRRLAGRP